MRKCRIVIQYVGDGTISAVNLQEVIKALLRRGIDLDAAMDIFGALQLDIRSHGRDEAVASAGLFSVSTQYGSGLGDRTCMALATAENLPVLTADRAWAKIKVSGLKVLLIRGGHTSAKYPLSDLPVVIPS